MQKPVTKLEISLWLESYLQKEALNAPEACALAGNAFDFISQMHELFKGHDMEKATPMEQQVFRGLNDYLHNLGLLKNKHAFQKSIALVRD